MLAGSSCGFLHEKSYEDRDDGAGDGGDDEGHAPSVALAYRPANQIAESGADGNGYIEDGEDAVALVFGVEVGEKRGCKDAKAGLSYTEGGVPDVERVVGVDAGREEVDTAPEEGGGDDHGLAWETIAQPTCNWRGEHVGDHEPESERADVLVGEVKLSFDLLLNTGEDVTVDVIYEVEGGEQDESCGRSDD